MRLLTTMILLVGFVAVSDAQDAAGPLRFEAAFDSAQKPLTPPPHPIPQQPNQLRTQQVRVTIEGCVFGKTLLPSLATNQPIDEALLNASEFVLEGPKDLMTQLTRNHDTHRERITGMATIPQPVGTTVETQGVTRGKTRVTTGARATGSEPGAAVALTAPLPVRLRVQSAEHVEEKCSPQRR